MALLGVGGEYFYREEEGGAVGYVLSEEGVEEVEGEEIEGEDIILEEGEEGEEGSGGKEAILLEEAAANFEAVD